MAGLLYDRECRTVRGRRVRYRRLKEPVGLFVYEGRIEGGDLQMWTELGYWRETGVPTDCDLVLEHAQGVSA
jgi:hypothetical protein